MFRGKKELYDEAKGLYQKKFFSDAFVKFDEILLDGLNHDDRALVLHYMALCKSYLGEVVGSLDLFERAKQADSEQQLIHFNQGLTYYFHAGKQKNPDQFVEMALRCLKQALFLDAANPEAWYYRGIMHKLLGQKEQAVYAYGNVLKLASRFPNREMCAMYEKLYVRKNLSAKEFSDDVKRE